MTVELILNHLWQTTAFGAVAAALAWALQGRQARVRFGVYWAASVKFLVPFTALVALGRMLTWARMATTAPAVPLAVAAPVVRAVGDPFGTQTLALPALSGGGSHFPAELLLGLWAAGTALLLVRWARRWVALARVARAGERREIGGLRVAICEGALEPGVFGIFRPVLLLPRGLEQRLTDAEFAAVLAHEREHVRRRDNLWSALHTLVESLFWFHPGVWWLGRKLVEERERACDEAVLAAGGDREAYASGIVNVCRYYAEMPAACAAGVSGGGLRQRVAQILRGEWGERLGARQKAMLWGLFAAVITAPLAAGLLLGQSAAASGAVPIPRIEFEAAAIHPAKPRGPNHIDETVDVDGAHAFFGNLSVKDLIALAYNVPLNQVIAPGAASSARWDIDAAVAPGTSSGNVVEMLQALLAQRFGLRVRTAIKVEPVYALVVCQRPLKIEALTLAEQKASHERFTFDNKELTVHNVTGETLARRLSTFLDRPVVNLTNLKGHFDVRLPMSRRDYDSLLARGFANDGIAMSPEAAKEVGSAPGSLAAALKQVGLGLDSRNWPIKLIAVDRARSTPTPN